MTSQLPRARGHLRFILLASPRSGSTTLSECLGMHPDLEVMFEPFHPAAGSPFSAERLVTGGGARALDLAAFDREVARISAGCDGFKHVLHQLPPLLGRRLLRGRRFRVIFLRRADLLRQAVSNLLAFASDVWHVGDGPWPPAQLPVLDCDRLAAMIDYYRDSQRLYRSILRRDRVIHRELTYEELFAERPWPEQRGILEQLFAFLGRPPITDPARLAQLRGALDPARNRLSSPAVYQQIPNWEEIERRLGGVDGSLLPR